MCYGTPHTQAWVVAPLPATNNTRCFAFSWIVVRNGSEYSATLWSDAGAELIATDWAGYEAWIIGPATLRARGSGALANNLLELNSLFRKFKILARLDVPGTDIVHIVEGRIGLIVNLN